MSAWVINFIDAISVAIIDYGKAVKIGVPSDTAKKDYETICSFNVTYDEFSAALQQVNIFI